MGAIYNIKKDLKREFIRSQYADHDRLIAPVIYAKLKGMKKCMRCGKNFSGQIPEIHHKVAVRDGGSNDEPNLMAVHNKCHKILDNEYALKRYELLRKNDKTRN